MKLTKQLVTKRKFISVDSSVVITAVIIRHTGSLETFVKGCLKLPVQPAHHRAPVLHSHVHPPDMPVVNTVQLPWASIATTPCSHAASRYTCIPRPHAAACSLSNPSSFLQYFSITNLPGVYAGLRAAGKKADLSLVVADEPASAAGVFTLNVMCAAPVTYCKDVLAKKQAVKAVGGVGQGVGGRGAAWGSGWGQLG